MIVTLRQFFLIGERTAISFSFFLTTRCAQFHFGYYGYARKINFCSTSNPTWISRLASTPRNPKSARLRALLSFLFLSSTQNMHWDQLFYPPFVKKPLFNIFSSSPRFVPEGKNLPVVLAANKRASKQAYNRNNTSLKKDPASIPNTNRLNCHGSVPPPPPLQAQVGCIWAAALTCTYEYFLRTCCYTSCLDRLEVGKIRWWRWMVCMRLAGGSAWL